MPSEWFGLDEYQLLRAFTSTAEGFFYLRLRRIGFGNGARNTYFRRSRHSTGFFCAGFWFCFAEYQVIRHCSWYLTGFSTRLLSDTSRRTAPDRKSPKLIGSLYQGFRKYETVDLFVWCPFWTLIIWNVFRLLYVILPPNARSLVKHGSPSCVTFHGLAAKNDCWWNTVDVFPGFHWLWLWKLPLQQNEQLSFSVGWKLLVKAKSNELKYGMWCISWKWRWIKCGTGKVRERWVKLLTIMFYQLTLEQL